MDTAADPTFSKWYHKFWPIRRFELRKLIPLLILKFLVSFIYAIFNVMKNTLVVTAEGGGAEAIPILKGFFVLPIALICAILYSKLSNKYTPSQLFYSIIGFFLLVALIYGFVLYPNMDALTPTTSADWLSNLLGQKHDHWVSIYRNWYHSLFFVVSELWASVVIFLLFWGFANNITSPGEAKRTYTIMIAAGDIATLVTGYITAQFITSFDTKGYMFTLQSLISIAVVLGIGMLVTYWWMHKYVLTDQKYFDPKKAQHEVEEKTKLSLWDSIKHIARSRYLLNIAVLVIGCALTMNIIEVTFHAAAKAEYPTKMAHQLFMANLTSYVGIIALITVFFLSGNLLRFFGWRFSAQITPLALGIGGLLFFFLTIGSQQLGPLSSFFGISPMRFLVIFGACQFVMGKVVKYSFFDSTKEMAFIPLDQESRVKGKAAIDLVGSRLGKSGSSWLQVGLFDLLGTGSVFSITPYLVPILALVVIGWIHSVRSLERTQEARKATI